MGLLALRYWMVLPVLLATCSCDYSRSAPTLAGSWEAKEISRVKSPDGSVELVLLEESAGATTSLVSAIYLVPSGGVVEPFRKGEQEACFAADHTSGLEAVWIKPDLVEIRYNEARIHRFANFWYHRDVQNFRFVVELRLAPSTNEYAVPFRDRH